MAGVTTQGRCMWAKEHDNDATGKGDKEDVAMRTTVMKELGESPDYYNNNGNGNDNLLPPLSSRIRMTLVTGH